MNALEPRVLELVEYQVTRLPAGELDEQDAVRIWEDYRNQVEITEPSFKNGRHWELCSLGWVGYIPVSERLELFLKPKVPLTNLFGMLEWAYRMDVRFLEGLYSSASLSEFYERLAMVLARRVLDRGRQGLYRAYVADCDDLAYVRGAMDLRERVRRPWSATVRCDFQDHTADVEENRLLAWTLKRIIQSGHCTERSLPTIRRAFRLLEGATSPASFTADNCEGRTYNRLCEDYRPMHALCRFFLDHSGTAHAHGDRRMIPFLVNMARLFERFVGAWLIAHLPPEFELKLQEPYRIGSRDDLEFRIDMLLVDRESRRNVLVMDAKYKGADGPSSSDLQQVIAYAEGMKCGRAILVYPGQHSRPLREVVGDITVESAAFDLSGELEWGGWELVLQLLPAPVAERMMEHCVPSSAESPPGKGP